MKKKLPLRKTNEALKPKNIKLTVKHDGGNVMVWEFMATNSVENLVFIDQIMRKEIFGHFKEKFSSKYTKTWVARSILLSAR